MRNRIVLGVFTLYFLMFFFGTIQVTLAVLFLINLGVEQLRKEARREKAEYERQYQLGRRPFRSPYFTLRQC